MQKHLIFNYMKVVINPKYNYLADFLNSLPYKKPVAEEVFQETRNYVYKVTVEDTPLVVKKYKRPTLANCVIYTWFRMGKAERSYKYAFRLEEMGFETAEPVAYIIQKKFGFLHTCYYVTIFRPHRLLSSYVECDLTSLRNLMNDFAEYTYNLHNSGIVHHDYSLNNILFHEEADKFKFTMIDINRVVFGRKFNRKQRIQGLNRLGFQLPLYGFFIERYAQLSGLNTDIFFGSLLIKRGVHITGRIKKRYKSLMKKMKSVFGKNN